MSRYHGGAYVVFSRALNDGLHALALDGSYASVIGGGAAATVVFAREVRARTASAAPARRAARAARAATPGRATPRARFERALERRRCSRSAARSRASSTPIHTVERARAVGSLDDIVDPASCART